MRLAMRLFKGKPALFLAFATQLFVLIKRRFFEVPCLAQNFMQV